MDILAPVLAYLTCVAGIIGAFLVSFYIVFSPPNQAAIPQRAAAIVSANTTKVVPPVDAKKPVLKGAVADNPTPSRAAPTTQKREEAAQSVAARGAPTQASSTQTSTPASASQKLAASEAHPGLKSPNPKSKITRAQWRQLVEQERRHRLAYQQDGDFESRFLGYAD
jgi:uncharacterized protein involved in copper resistance